jgi:hypothetical protein
MARRTHSHRDRWREMEGRFGQRFGQSSASGNEADWQLTVESVGGPPAVSALINRVASSRRETLQKHLGWVAEEDLADGFVMGVAGLDLLGDGVDVAGAALDGAAGEDRIDAGGLVDGVADRDGAGDRLEPARRARAQSATSKVHLGHHRR